MSKMILRPYNAYICSYSFIHAMNAARISKQVGHACSKPGISSLFNARFRFSNFVKVRVQTILKSNCLRRFISNGFAW